MLNGIEQNASSFEKHYRIGDLARLWGLGRETVRQLVKDDPGVLKIRIGRKKRRPAHPHALAKQRVM